MGNDQNDTVMIGRSAGQHLLDVAGVPLALDVCTGGLPCPACNCREDWAQEPKAKPRAAQRVIVIVSFVHGAERS